MFLVDYRMRDQFFDRPGVQRAADKAKRKALSQIGAFVRKRSRSSLRKRKRPSPAGKPPSVHATDRVATLRNIWFVYEPRSDSVVIGPLRLNGAATVNGARSSTTIPGIHEHGATVAVRERQVRIGGRLRWTAGVRRRRRRIGEPREKTRTRRAKYEPRPFMGPALDAEVAAGTIPEAFAFGP